MGYAVLIITIFLVLFRVPIGFALFIPSTIYLMIKGIPLTIIPQRMFSAYDSITLLAIPLFILSGPLMSKGGLTERLLSLANRFVGRFTGGLGMTVAVAASLFGMISGSAGAATAAIGSMTLPQLAKQGYKKDWSVAFMATAATTSIMIPPSIPSVLYGVAANASIGKLFLAGVFPGVLLTIGVCIMSYIHAKKHNIRPMKENIIDTKEPLIKVLVQSLWAVMMPVIIVGGVLLGITTPTEAAAVAVVYAFLVSGVIYRKLTIRDIFEMLKDTTILTSSILFIVAGASIFAWVLTIENVPQDVVSLLSSISDNSYIILLLIVIFYLILGTFMETAAAIIMTTPLLLPIINQYGIDPVHFGMVVITSLAVGLYTPPVGVVLYIAANVANIPIRSVLKQVLPFVIVGTAIVLATAFLPGLVMWLPNLIVK